MKFSMSDLSRAQNKNNPAEIQWGCFSFVEIMLWQAVSNTGGRIFRSTGAKPIGKPVYGIQEGHIDLPFDIGAVLGVVEGAVYDGAGMFVPELLVQIPLDQLTILTGGDQELVR